MKEVNYLIECVPNISEGRDLAKIDEIIAFIDSPNLNILNVDGGFDANRTVITITGNVNVVIAAIKKLYVKTSKIIDMSIHRGEHSRLGAVDICPFTPLDQKNVEDLKMKVWHLADELSAELSIPVFLYAKSSIGREVKTLPVIRKGEYEALIHDPSSMNHSPDFGEGLINKAFGGTVMGVRGFMVAYNVNLNTSDLTVAKKIAKEMRRIRNEEKFFRSIEIGPLQILGWYMEAFGCCQISTNIHNPRSLSIADVYEFTKEISYKFGVEVVSSELIGMLPQFAVDLAKRSLIAKGVNTSLVESLGLDFNGPFNWSERIISF